MSIKVNGIKIAGRGMPGKSAYQSAVDAGYEGTETEFGTELANVPTDLEINGDYLSLKSGSTVLSTVTIEGGSKVGIANVSGASATPGPYKVSLTWSDPQDTMSDTVTLAAWAGTKIIRKQGSAPTNAEDGTLVVDNKTRNQYSSTAFVDTGLENDKIYYYAFFPYTTKNVYASGSSVSATPERIVIATVPTVAVNPTYSGSAQSPTWNDYDATQLTVEGAEATNAGEYTASFTPTANYKWSDNSITAKEVAWTMQKKQAVITTSKSAVTLDKENTSATFTVGGEGCEGFSVVSADTNVATVSLSDGTVTVSSVNNKTGVVAVTISASAASDNYIAPVNASVSVNARFVQLVSWSTGTDSEIADMVAAYYAGDFTLAQVQSVWSVGDVRTVTLSAMAATGVGESHRSQSVQLVILDFEHDTLTTPINGKTKALISVQQKDCLTSGVYSTMSEEYNASGTNKELGYMNSSNTNSGGWSSCARRTWCNGIYYNAIPSGIQTLIKPVNKLTSAGGQSSTINTTSDKVWLLSEIEIFGSTTYSFTGEGSKYSYYNTISNRNKLPKWNSSSASGSWWERSPNSSYSTAFCSVGSDGTADLNIASDTYGLAPAFSL